MWRFLVIPALFAAISIGALANGSPAIGALAGAATFAFFAFLVHRRRVEVTSEVVRKRAWPEVVDVPVTGLEVSLVGEGDSASLRFSAHAREFGLSLGRTKDGHYWGRGRLRELLNQLDGMGARIDERARTLSG
jgi:hypothetical protein